jgi:hypothetical protein
MKKFSLFLSLFTMMWLTNPSQSLENATFIPKAVCYDVSGLILSDFVEQYLQFSERLGFLESTNNYQAVSRSGTFMGRYQFSERTLTDINLDVDSEYYLSSPYVQEMSLFLYLKTNKRYLGEYFHKYVGETVGDWYVSSAGILASAHLVGHRNVIAFLESGGEFIKQDGNGTPLTKYLEEFSDLDIYLSEDIAQYIEYAYR